MTRKIPPPPADREDEPFRPTRVPRGDYADDFEAFWAREGDRQSGTPKDLGRVAFTAGLRAAEDRLLHTIHKWWEIERDSTARAALARCSSAVAGSNRRTT